MQFVDDMILGAAIGFSERNGSGPAGGGQTVRRLSRTSQQDKKGSDAIGAPDLAEKEGFEPSDGFTHHTISSRAPSTKLGDFSKFCWQRSIL